MTKTKKFVIRFFICLFIFLGISTMYLFTRNMSIDNQADERLKQKAKEAFDFCKKNGYDTNFCVLIDMKIHSGKYRMFVWNFKENKVEHKSLCAHGCGRDDLKSTGSKPLFGNVDGSLLSSLGKYKLGARSGSQWGVKVHYKMHGLEPTNSNAFRRIIVLHSHTPVSSAEIYPLHMPMGWSQGCPVTDNSTMTYLDNKLKLAKKPVLLWIYY